MGTVSTSEEILDYFNMCNWQMPESVTHLGATLTTKKDTVTAVE